MLSSLNQLNLFFITIWWTKFWLITLCFVTYAVIWWTKAIRAVSGTPFSYSANVSLIKNRDVFRARSNSCRWNCRNRWYFGSSGRRSKNRPGGDWWVHRCSGQRWWTCSNRSIALFLKTHKRKEKCKLAINWFHSTRISNSIENTDLPLLEAMPISEQARYVSCGPQANPWVPFEHVPQLFPVT